MAREINIDIGVARHADGTRGVALKIGDQTITLPLVKMPEFIGAVSSTFAAATGEQAAFEAERAALMRDALKVRGT